MSLFLFLFLFTFFYFYLAPQNISIPAIVPATSRQIDVRFYAPGILNGVITAYRITRNGLEVFNGLPPSSGSPPLYVYNDRNLLPYTTYQYVVYSVNGGGATASPTLSGTTLEECMCFIIYYY